MPAPSSTPGARVVALLVVPLLWAVLALPAAAQQLATWASLAPSVEPYDDPFAEMPFEQIDALRIIARADMAAVAGQLDEEMAEAAKQARVRANETGLRDECCVYRKRPRRALNRRWLRQSRMAGSGFADLRCAAHELAQSGRIRLYPQARQCPLGRI